MFTVLINFYVITRSYLYIFNIYRTNKFFRLYTNFVCVFFLAIITAVFTSLHEFRTCFFLAITATSSYPRVQVLLVPTFDRTFTCSR